MMRKFGKDNPAFRHGHSNDRTYRTWKSMKERCLNKSNASYPNYGKRGITISKSWIDFKGFLRSMGIKPLGMTLERINVNGNYTPKNCKWATIEEQNRNKRTVKLYPYKGNLLTIALIAKKTGMSKSTLRQRLENGWETERAIYDTRDGRKIKNEDHK